MREKKTQARGMFKIKKKKEEEEIIAAG